MGSRRTLVREVNPHLICVLCRGYFIEATTITECLHSFCRSCLVKYLETSKFCPICDVQLHKTNPLLSVRCDPILQQLVYKLIPGLYANEMVRRRKYYSELGGPSSDPDCGEFPVGDAYFAPEDSISLSLEFTTNSLDGKDGEAEGSDIEGSPFDKQGILHRRYLQCPAAVTMSHLQKFLRMKYGFSHDVKVDIIYEGEVLTEQFSLMDVAYTFDWKRTAPMRFKFRLLQKFGVASRKICPKKVKSNEGTKENEEVTQKPTAEAKVFAFASNVQKTSNYALKTFPSQTPSVKRVEEMKKTRANDVVEQKPVQVNDVEPNKVAKVTSCESQEVNNLKETRNKPNNATEKPFERSYVNGSLKRLSSNEKSLDNAPPETKKLKIILEPLPKNEMKKSILPFRSEAQKADSKESLEASKFTADVLRTKSKVHREEPVVQEAPKVEVKNKTPVHVTPEPEEEEPNYMDDIIREDDDDDYEDEDRLIIPTSDKMEIEEEEDETLLKKSVEKTSDPVTIKLYSRSEVKRKEKKKNKKAKHHHHRHHDRRRDSSPPMATILHSPDNDLKLKFKLTNSNSKTKYTILDNSDSKKNSSPKHREKEPKNKNNDFNVEHPKKIPSPVLNNNYNNVNNNTFPSKEEAAKNNEVVDTGSKEKFVPLMKISKPKVVQNQSPKVASPAPKPSPTSSPVPKQCPSPKHIPLVKQNGIAAAKAETVKLPPSSITVSKITAAEKAQMEQQKFFMNRNISYGLESKRPSLEIMLVNAPKKANDAAEAKPVEVKKVIRPTPPSIPLSRLKNFGSKGSPPPLVLTGKSSSGNDENGALDLSGKSSRKSPEIDNMRNLVMLSNTAAQERGLSSLEPLKIPIPPVTNMNLNKPGYQMTAQRTIKPGPNQTVRQIPNPSALMFRQHALNHQRSVPPSLPINSLRKMETMTKSISIEKVAAGLSVKAAVEAGYHGK